MTTINEVNVLKQSIARLEKALQGLAKKVSYEYIDDTNFHHVHNMLNRSNIALLKRYDEVVAPDNAVLTDWLPYDLLPRQHALAERILEALDKGETEFEFYGDSDIEYYKIDGETNYGV